MKELQEEKRFLLFRPFIFLGRAVKFLLKSICSFLRSILGGFKHLVTGDAFLGFLVVAVAVLLFIAVVMPRKDQSSSKTLKMDPDCDLEWLESIREKPQRKSSFVVNQTGEVSKKWEFEAKKNGLDKLFHQVNTEYGEYIRERCRVWGYDSWQEVPCVICKESSGKADAVSSKGAMGFTGIMPETGREFGIKDSIDLLNPYISIDVCVQKLVKLQKNNSKSDVFLKYEYGVAGAKKVKDQLNRTRYYRSIQGILAAAKKISPIEDLAEN